MRHPFVLLSLPGRLSFFSLSILRREISSLAALGQRDRAATDNSQEEGRGRRRGERRAAERQVKGDQHPCGPSQWPASVGQPQTQDPVHPVAIHTHPFVGAGARSLLLRLPASFLAAARLNMGGVGWLSPVHGSVRVSLVQGTQERQESGGGVDSCQKGEEWKRERAIRGMQNKLTRMRCSLFRSAADLIRTVSDLSCHFSPPFTDSPRVALPWRT
jgi:hypothetical protein